MNYKNFKGTAGYDPEAARLRQDEREGKRDSNVQRMGETPEWKRLAESIRQMVFEQRNHANQERVMGQKIITVEYEEV